MLLVDPAKIPFSTVSAQLGPTAMSASCPLLGGEALVPQTSALPSLP
jgi:hypothetical protein